MYFLMWTVPCSFWYRTTHVLWDVETSQEISELEQSNISYDVEQSHLICHVEQSNVVSDIEQSYVVTNGERSHIVSLDQSHVFSEVEQ